MSFRAGLAEHVGAAGPGELVDLVLSNDVLHHVGDQSATARAARVAARPGATWLAIEPSWINPYVCYYHLRTPGERLFFPRRFLEAAADSGWRLVGTRRLFLIPTAIADPPEWLRGAERILERAPLLSRRDRLELEAA